MPIVQPLQGSRSLNPTQEAYDKRSSQLQAGRAAEDKSSLDAQTRKNNDFHKVAKYAADGYIEEARYYNKMTNAGAPEKMFTEAAFNQSIALAGDLYGDDKVGAQKYGEASYLAPPGTSSRERHNMGLAASPISDINNRKNQNVLKMYEEKLKLEEQYRKPEKPDDGLYKAGQAAYTSGLRGDLTANEALLAREDALNFYKKMHPPRQSGLLTKSPGTDITQPYKESPEFLYQQPPPAPQQPPPASAIEFLKRNINTLDQFNAKYGAGAAESVLRR